MVDCKTCEYEKICEFQDFIQNDIKLCRTYEEKKPQTNADRIRSMSDEELAEFLIDHHRYPCKYCISCWADRESDEMGCGKGLIQWLKSEAKE